ncbi:MAG: hypothetical protein A2383_03975 [Candidatus Pacebacteria bacterium RIFOXYB1_FULL_39_46]|nr:MAG: Nuclear protein SET [Candidatus Pacebacteria bacterium GW2011_GWF1_36_5]OGJ38382.1 MAG: hypothetical protein A2182_04230 [Candidatus Pacebacteria bacterium RIFOXYA1_FULL_38_18]OGJ38567.1 MAG: hypothetical protein A2383_03975 [Candidatus Pacebacteria bacterium RIFOXYB1_FULL_39_46]OGJ40427.1 MAG: hypothetical protein A2411_04115 [Candidatus Pacebacteria bacterium RIFOXYC1_FULL_39_21]OGJ40546.1 MAG: hypothetical protein A2582_02860 [Candidatus Pacebacteria bacterium RIFOXYD1_FULL_39_27]
MQTTQADIYPPTKIVIKNTPSKGRGVFAISPISKNEVIEIAPIVVLGKYDSEIINNKNSVLYYYSLEQVRLKRDCIMLGYSSLYNHSDQPNCDWEYDDNKENRFLRIRALVDINPGEELTIDYDDSSTEQEFMPEEMLKL